MDADPGSGSSDLSWGNVGLAFSFIVFDAFISMFYGLGVGSSLVTAAVRCVLQLSVVALILQKIFETNNPWAVAGIARESLACSFGCTGLMRQNLSLIELDGYDRDGYACWHYVLIFLTRPGCHPIRCPRRAAHSHDLSTRPASGNATRSTLLLMS